ncbi:MAG: spore protease YyaC [Firmicutes bacterium]|nr:spore protease YyaC [Bacillota bacterium]
MLGDFDDRIDVRRPDASRRLCAALLRLLEPERRRPICVLCIGSDRSTGDSLGPLVGSELKKARLPGVTVLGDLEKPLHAGNLVHELAGAPFTDPSTLKIAVDACLGTHDHVGSVLVGRGSLRPGAGLYKTLPAVGDVFVTGTVNVGGFMEYLVLQSTRLGLVIAMAEVIACGLHWAIASLSGAKIPRADAALANQSGP